MEKPRGRPSAAGRHDTPPPIAFSSSGVYTAAPVRCRIPAAHPDGSGGTAGTVAGPRGESDEKVRSASLSARARQLTPQAIEREGRGTQQTRRPALVGGSFLQSRRSALLAPSGPRAAAATTGGAPTAAGGPRARRSPPARRPADAPSAGDADPRLGQDHATQILLLRLPLSEPALRDRQQPAAERPAHRRRRRSRRSRQAASTATTSPRTRVQHPLGRHDAPKGGRRRNGRYSFRIGAQGGSPVAAGRPPRAEPLSLGFDFYGYAFPILGPHDFGDAARAASAPRAPATPTRART